MAYTFLDPAMLGLTGSTTYWETGYLDNAGFVTDPPNEPDPEDLYRSAWFAYTPVQSGVLEVHSDTSAQVSYLSAYTGYTKATAVRVSQAGKLTGIKVRLNAGTTYRIRIASPTDDAYNYFFFATYSSTIPPLPPANDLFATPAEAQVTGGTFVSDAASADWCDIQTGEPGTGYRSTWWSYTPTASGTATIDTNQSSQPFDTILTVYTGTSFGNLVEVATDDDSGTPADQGHSQITDLPVTAGTTYLIRASAYQAQSGGEDYILAVTGPDTPATDITRNAPPATVVADILTATAVSDTTPILSAAPADVCVDPLTASLITATVSLIAPVDGAITPGRRPLLTVGVATNERVVTLEVRVATDLAFTAPITMTATVPRGQALNRTTVQLSADLANDATYFWQARVRNAWDATAWTAARTLTVSALDGDAIVAGGWTVQRGATVAAPHLWFITPDAGTPGDQATVVGTALGTPAVTLADAPAVVGSVVQVPADSTAFTADRVINTTEISPAHTTVTFTVPAVAGPGGVLYVDAS